MTKLPLITNSECTTYRRCPREHQIAYTQNIRPIAKAPALGFGTAIHAALERYWLGGSMVTSKSEYSDEYEYQRAAAMLDGYAARWGRAATVLGVEQQFEAPLADPTTRLASSEYSIGGKLDAVMRDERGDDWVVEHKSSSQDISPGSSYWAKLRMDSQISTYLVGARSLGYRPRGVLYDVLGKPDLDPRNTPILDENEFKIVRDASGQRVRTKDGKKWRETGDAKLGYVLLTRPETPAEYGERCREAIKLDPDKYYQRAQIVRLEAEEADAARDMWQFASLIHRARVEGIAPRNPDACQRYGSVCPYWQACVGEVSLDDRTRYEIVETNHQELAAQ